MVESGDLSSRLVDQRLRNRIMERLQTLAHGNEGVRKVEPTEYFESFYDYIPHRGDGEMRLNSAMTNEERRLLGEVSEILDNACDATPNITSVEEFIATGWPRKVQRVAARACRIMNERGRFDEDREEDAPSATKS